MILIQNRLNFIVLDIDSRIHYKGIILFYQKVNGMSYQNLNWYYFCKNRIINY